METQEYLCGCCKAVAPEFAKFQVQKSSRCSPTNTNLPCKCYNRAIFATLEQAIYVAEYMADENPVGFDVYPYNEGVKGTRLHKTY